MERLCGFLIAHPLAGPFFLVIAIAVAGACVGLLWAEREQRRLLALQQRLADLEQHRAGRKGNTR